VLYLTNVVLRPAKSLVACLKGQYLGPYYFFIYINDIDTVCCGNTHLQLFADDAKLYSSINVDEASVLLQRSLDNLCTWASEWQLTINISKCAVISISSRVTATCTVNLFTESPSHT
jgi:hypothetical protein